MLHSAPTPLPIHWVLMFSIGLIWGTSFMFVDLALNALGPRTIVAGRVILAAVLLLGLSFGMGKGLPSLRGSDAKWVWLSAFGIGLFSNALPFNLLSWGQQYVASGFAGVSMATVPLIVLPLAHLMVPGERMTVLKTLGFVIGFAGVILLIGPEAFRTLGVENEATARIACIGAAACYAIGNIITRLCPDVSKIALAAAAMLFAAMLSVPPALMTEGLPELSWLPVICVITLGVFATAGAKLVQVKLVREAGPTFMVLVNYQVPIWSLFFGWLVLGEHLPAKFFLALALILTGMAFSQWRSLRALAGMMRRPARVRT